MPYEIELLWKTDNPHEAGSLLSELGNPAIGDLERSIEAAVKGQSKAVYVYVRSWRLLTKILLRMLSEVRPDLVTESDGQFRILDIKDTPTNVVEEVLAWTAVNAPFSPWVATMRPHLGASVYLVSELRKYTPGFHAIPLHQEISAFPHWEIEREDFSKFARRVWLLLQEKMSPLERIRQAFELSDSELGRLFGVSRQAVDQWVEQGVPRARSAKVHSVLSIVEALEHNLRPERIPAVVRQPASVFKGKTTLQMIQADRHMDAARVILRSFDWAVTA